MDISGTILKYQILIILYKTSSVKLNVYTKTIKKSPLIYPQNSIMDLNFKEINKF